MPACAAAGAAAVPSTLQPASPAAAVVAAAADHTVEHAVKHMQQQELSQPCSPQAQQPAAVLQPQQPVAVPQPQQLQQDSQGEEPCTPQAGLSPELLAVFQQMWQDGQHLQDCDGGQQPPAQLQQQPCTGCQGDAAAACSQPCQHASPATQQPVFAGPATPLLFIATTTRHSGCLRHPSFRANGSPRSSSCAGSGFAPGAPPLPSPAESPLARRLSARDCSGLPAASPALKQLIFSGAGSLQQLRRGGSLDSRRAVSTPGSTRGSFELQLHEQQLAPWAGFQLRPVPQRQQQLQDEEEGAAAAAEAAAADGAPWYRRFQLERRHTFANTLELSVAADGAVAAVDGAGGAAAEAAAGAMPACGTSSSRSPLRRQLLGPFNSHAGSSGMDGPQLSAHSTGSPCVAAVGGLTPHRLSCSSSASDSHLESEGSGAADAAAAVVLAPAAGLQDCKPQQQDSVALSWA